GPAAHRGEGGRWQAALGVRLRPLLRPQRVRAAQGQGGLVAGAERDEHLPARPAAHLPQLRRQGREPRRQAAGPRAGNPRGLVGPVLPRQRQVSRGRQRGTTVGILSLILVLAADDPADSLAKKMLPLYVKEAAEYSMAVESDPKKELE